MFQQLSKGIGCRIRNNLGRLPCVPVLPNIHGSFLTADYLLSLLFDGAVVIVVLLLIQTVDISQLVESCRMYLLCCKGACVTRGILQTRTKVNNQYYNCLKGENRFLFYGICVFLCNLKRNITKLW